MKKQTIEIILSEEIQGLTTEALVNMINLSEYMLPFPDDYGKIKAKPVFNCDNVTIVLERNKQENI